ncbi:EF-P beta-lysylation protein EpmB [Ferrimonas sediminicola]|uniref:L-lysine 2,3-aminomutase n=1 Tax=Ferrimonas sediminicola TaxID=2569538 RepID=A0A4U1BIY2_9GAMM|nr:EF-P beta-lysylation protein EpmB [Ferrimonas sediminicola]TKB51359.1 EF-P beta-lysylation protein EpmB [Ferrimonas sediminicola]
MITRNSLNLHDCWQQELAQAYTDPKLLLQALDLDPAEFAEDMPARALFPMRVPRPFVAAMERGNPRDPLLLQVLPSAREFAKVAGYGPDPLKEQQAAVPGILHKYRSRALLMLKGGCAVNCRYCFRRHFPYGENQLRGGAMNQALVYLAEDTRLNEVILSGGDPLMAKDTHLQRLVAQLDALPHLTRLRIHTRLPVVLPSRLTPELTRVLNQSRLKVVLVLHINHPNEITPQLRQGLSTLNQAGVTLLNQAVLLKGVNDSVSVQTRLSETLFDAGVLPYYLHLLDKVEGAAHFDLPESHARALMAQLLEALPGFLVPRLVREVGGRHSKTPVDLQLA